MSRISASCTDVWATLEWISMWFWIATVSKQVRGAMSKIMHRNLKPKALRTDCASQGPLGAYQLHSLSHLHHLRAFDLSLATDTGAPQLPGGFPMALLTCTRLEALHISCAGERQSCQALHKKLEWVNQLSIALETLLSKLICHHKVLSALITGDKLVYIWEFWLGHADRQKEFRIIFTDYQWQWWPWHTARKGKSLPLFWISVCLLQCAKSVSRFPYIPPEHLMSTLLLVTSCPALITQTGSDCLQHPTLALYHALAYVGKLDAIIFRLIQAGPEKCYQQCRRVLLSHAADWAERAQKSAGDRLHQVRSSWI